ncbi:MAG: hypothetical protein ABEI06_08450 [Halobacteriaceae archaeon]
MSLSDMIQDRVIMLGGHVAGVDCPQCEYESQEIEIDPVEFSNVSCPECGATILTEKQKSELRQAGKI